MTLVCHRQDQDEKSEGATDQLDVVGVRKEGGIDDAIAAL
jgi:hypothetical protein